MPIRVTDWPTVNPCGLIENEASAELRGIWTKRDDEVAAVETQTVIRPRPQTTWPVTIQPVIPEVRMKTPQMSVASAKE